ncbi:phytoene desaturase family protein [Rubinisphaera margarita]|uniref:phytoene desaturase family protein n=1 Tax=Rubinisphaera margarita TaxID=2909586 RepID=UPI001EE9930F|nr:NAD(P)/FAD-dependent oxidoreductase [Rubinisphaera margarita]MCG6155726.1 NAD(P)/FAD-dependent oxidoreductase [Rubinisphaera margarita]
MTSISLPRTDQFAETPSRNNYDAVVVGSGPNGLSAAITLAEVGWRVLVMEARQTPGGGLRTAELTEPGFHHDICASIMAFAPVSPFFRHLEGKLSLDWVRPAVPCAHPLDDGRAGLLHDSLEETARQLSSDGERFRRLMQSFAQHSEAIYQQVLGPLRPPQSHPLALARFGWYAIRSAQSLANRFQTSEARGLIAGIAAHSGLPLTAPTTSAVALLLGLSGLKGGWPVVKGGAQQLTRALCEHLQSLGGEVVINSPVRSLQDLPASRAVLFDLVPRTVIDIARGTLPDRYLRRLEKFRHGPGVWKVDWALSDPIPWQNESCRKAGTVHVGGSFEELAAGEQSVWDGTSPHAPFVLLTQPSVCDDTRAPDGQHTAWGYCRVPAGNTIDMTERIEAQIERFAPGFRDCIRARHVTTPSDFESYNANYVQGDIAAGVMDWRQAFARPVVSPCPYATPHPRLYLCSASTPPGPGIHGMGGYHAAKVVLKRISLERIALPYVRE